MPETSADEALRLKVLENRIRRMADRQGLHIIKSRRRDPLALDYGQYKLLDEDNRKIITGSLDQIEQALTQGRRR